MKATILLLIFFPMLYHATLPAQWIFGENVKVNDDTVGAYHLYPSITVDEAGNAYCVWEDCRSGNSEVYFSYRRLYEGWQKNVCVYDTSCTGNPFPQIVVDQTGNASCVWSAGLDGGVPKIWFAERPADSVWTANVRIDEDSTNNAKGHPRLAIDQEGTVYALWTAGPMSNPMAANIFFTLKPKAGTWGANEQVNDVAGGVSYPSFGADANGNCYSVWQDSRNYAQYNDDIYFSCRPKGGTWGPAERVNDDYVAVGQTTPQLAVDNNGNCHCCWKDTRGMSYYAYRPHDSSWSKSHWMRFQPEDLAADNRGNVFAVWSEISMDMMRVFFSYKSPDSDWATPLRVNDKAAGVLPSLAVDASGKIYCAWVDSRDNPVYGNIYFCTGTTTGIAENDNSRAEAIDLQLIPNPSKGNVRFTVTGTRDRSVKIRIYDIRGNMAKELKAENFSANGIVWNGKDERGMKVSTGVYFCQLIAPATMQPLKVSKLVISR